MKVFEFDPATGRRGALIDNRRIASWGDCSITFAVGEGQIAPIEHVEPDWHNCDVTCHIDAGIEVCRPGESIEFVSYREPDKWICFSTGQYTSGLEQGMWDWWVIPPTSAIKRL